MPGKFLALALILTGLLASLACSNAPAPSGRLRPRAFPPSPRTLPPPLLSYPVRPPRLTPPTQPNPSRSI